MQYHHNKKTNIAQEQGHSGGKVARPNRKLTKQYCVSHMKIYLHKGAKEARFLNKISTI